jgi:hypothetical protein
MYFNTEFQYTLTQIPYIENHIDQIKEITRSGIDRFKRNRGMQNHSAHAGNLTWMFNQYNLFALYSNNQHFYEIYKNLISAIREYFNVTGTDVPSQLWLQSWVNGHTKNQILKSHNHEWPIHGYISIDPKHTETVFTDAPNGNELYRITNKVGQIYVGPGSRFHHVELLEPFEGERITFGYDVEYRDRILDNMSFIPIIL